MPLVGFLFDTTLAAAQLVFSGVAERFPASGGCSGHLGGAIPYLAERLDRGFETFTECREHPTGRRAHLKRSTTTRSTSIRAAAPGDRVCRRGSDPGGSDYPHQIGSIPKMLPGGRDWCGAAPRRKIWGKRAWGLDQPTTKAFFSLAWFVFASPTGPRSMSIIRRIPVRDIPPDPLAAAASPHQCTDCTPHPEEDSLFAPRCARAHPARSHPSAGSPRSAPPTPGSCPSRRRVPPTSRLPTPATCGPPSSTAPTCAA